MPDRYHDSYWPKPQTCPTCGMTARPVHQDPLPPDRVFCPFCGGEVPFETCKPNNYDKIQKMRMEELAKYLYDSDACPHEKCRHPYEMLDCDMCWLDWLKQEVENA